MSTGCDNCYAAAFNKRIGRDDWGKDAPRRFFGEEHWAEPLKWNAEAAALGERHRVFCASMADVFEDRPDLVAERAKLWPLIEATPSLDWLLLTKRPAAQRRVLPWAHREPWPNVWLGTTVENRDYLWRTDELRKVKAAVRFISYEPALGPIADAIDLAGIDDATPTCSGSATCATSASARAWRSTSSSGPVTTPTASRACARARSSAGRFTCPSSMAASMARSRWCRVADPLHALIRVLASPAGEARVDVDDRAPLVELVREEMAKAPASGPVDVAGLRAANE